MVQRDASELYQIPRSTIKNKLAQKFQGKPGRPPIFSENEEQCFVAHITALSEFGFPLTDFDLKMIIRDYLTSQGRVVEQFKNNVPGKDWVNSFFLRHAVLCRRLANNIKSVRAQVSKETTTEFIDNITTVLEGKPAENIYNYDETNLCDDPGRKKVICRRGAKYPEFIINATKVNFTVMFCGNAAGEAVLTYIIHKSDHLWSTWKENGPPGARYNRTKSGWIDTATFEDWFLTHLMPILKKKEGKKVVIGDNLSSHISIKVLEECKKENICFVCLPSNSTHILQPLDVAYFRPLKNKWRQVLLDWKSSQSGRNLPTLPKDEFPSLLKKALDVLLSQTKDNMAAGFRKTGIFPTDKERPLTRLPMRDRIVNKELITEAFMKKLEEVRASGTQKKTTKKRKLEVAPGKSITAEDIIEAGSSVQNISKNQTKNRHTVGTQRLKDN
ncbi:hypothetical protein O0L34_g9252 [Tuta absoluta]|nr:hypothetical protein O0L34_g9252 [Tuta absoluta]